MKRRFHNIGYKLFVALQSDFPRGALSENYIKAGVNPDNIFTNENRGQIFHPASEVQHTPDASRVVFDWVTNGKEDKTKLVFFSKIRSIAARFGEEKAFGFEKTRPGDNYRGHDYLCLAYPGITGEFSPLFIKVKPKGKKTSFCLKIEAKKTEKGENIVVTTERTKDVPSHLYFN